MATMSYDDLLGDYTTPDGKLCLQVTAPSNDLTIGFDGYFWHTHSDMLYNEAGDLPPIEATRVFLARLFANELFIVISSVNGTIREVWIHHTNEFDSSRLEPGETLTFRLWDGRVVEGFDVSASGR